MSKRTAHVTVDKPLAEPTVEAPVLEPNDALILMLLARYPKQVPDRTDRLISMLSSEGKLIAQALMGTVDEKTLPTPVIATAEGLRKWVKSQLSPARNRPSRVKGRIDVKARAETPTNKGANQESQDLETVLA